MSHDTPTVAAEKRDRTGSRFTERLRNQGRLPAVVYGHKKDPVAVSVDAKEILTLLHQGIHVINLDVQGVGTETCLVKDLQFGYLGDNVIHLDFARVDMSEEVELRVHIEFVGEAKEATEANTFVEYDQTELTVRCRVSDIPESVRVDLTTMEGTQLHASDIVLPDGLTAVEPQTLVVSIHHRHMEESVGEEVEVATDGSEPEVITEAKESETES